MFKLLKWNFLDYFKKNTWILIGMAVSLLLVAIPGNGIGFFNNFLIVIASITGFIVFQAGILSAVLFAYRWAENASVTLELSLPVSSWKQIVAKLATSALVNFLSCIFLLKLFLSIGRFSNGSFQWITTQNLTGIFGLVVFLSFLESTILFAYIFSRSYRVMRGTPDFFTVLISVAIIGTVTFCTAAIMAASGQLLLPTISTDSILTLNGTLQVLSAALPIWIYLVSILLECFFGSRLLQNRFQVN